MPDDPFAALALLKENLHSACIMAKRMMLAERTHRSLATQRSLAQRVWLASRCWRALRVGDASGAAASIAALPELLASVGFEGIEAPELQSLSCRPRCENCIWH